MLAAPPRRRLSVASTTAAGVCRPSSGSRDRGRARWCRCGGGGRGSRRRRRRLSQSLVVFVAFAAFDTFCRLFARLYLAELGCRSPRRIDRLRRAEEHGGLLGLRDAARGHLELGGQALGDVGTERRLSQKGVDIGNKGKNLIVEDTGRTRAENLAVLFGRREKPVAEVCIAMPHASCFDFGARRRDSVGNDVTAGGQVRDLLVCGRLERR